MALPGAENLGRMSSGTCRRGRVMLRAMAGRQAAGEWTGGTTLMMLGWNYNVAWGAARPRRLGYPKPCIFQVLSLWCCPSNLHCPKVAR